VTVINNTYQKDPFQVVNHKRDLFAIMPGFHNNLLCCNLLAGTTVWLDLHYIGMLRNR